MDGPVDPGSATGGPWTSCEEVGGNGCPVGATQRLSSTASLSCNRGRAAHVRGIGTSGSLGNVLSVQRHVGGLAPRDQVGGWLQQHPGPGSDEVAVTPGSIRPVGPRGGAVVGLFLGVRSNLQ